MTLITSRASCDAKNGILWIKFIKRWPPRGVPLLWIPIFIFLLFFQCKKKRKFCRVKGRFKKPPLNLESPPWTLKRQLKAHSNAFYSNKSVFFLIDGFPKFSFFFDGIRVSIRPTSSSDSDSSFPSASWEEVFSAFAWFVLCLFAYLIMHAFAGQLEHIHGERIVK